MSLNTSLNDIDLPIPDDPYRIDRSWFEQLMACHGCEVQIASIAVEGIGGGLMGQNVRYRFDYEKADDPAPATLIGKFPTTGAMTLKFHDLVDLLRFLMCYGLLLY